MQLYNSSFVYICTFVCLHFCIFVIKIFGLLSKFQMSRCWGDELFAKPTHATTTNKSTNQVTNQPSNQLTNQPANQQTNQPASKPKSCCN